MAEEPTYKILDGVRRSKAALLSGKGTIAAQVNGVGPVLMIPLTDLLSPKDEVDTTGVRGLSWVRILRATQQGVLFPPIEVVAGSSGTPLADVRILENDLDAIRRHFATSKPGD